VKYQLLEWFEYSYPLVVLDTFHVKAYSGVDPVVLEEKRKEWIQVSGVFNERFSSF